MVIKARDWWEEESFLRRGEWSLPTSTCEKLGEPLTGSLPQTSGLWTQPHPISVRWVLVRCPLYRWGDRGKLDHTGA